MIRTKIVATIGPATSDPGAIRELLQAGMNVARINFSHGDHAIHSQTIAHLRAAAADEGKVLAILGDLQGPKLRLGSVAGGSVEVAVGDEITLSAHPGAWPVIHFPQPEIIAATPAGARLIIGDGEVELTVLTKDEESLSCRVDVDGPLRSRKGVSIPGVDLPIASITAKDKDDLAFICRMDLDYVAISFVRTANDVVDLRQRLTALGAGGTPIIAKIEKLEAIDNLDQILAVSDGLMVARGDLGIEVAPEEVPLLQKRIIKRCNEAGKPVVTATQMLQSMVSHPRPTRAEASDVANAILDGSDAVMLSEETAVGEHPVESVLMMAKIAEMTEKEFPYDLWRGRRVSTVHQHDTAAEAISVSSCQVADQVSARYIITSTVSGYTARQIARHRPATPVVAVTPSEKTQRQLALVWGAASVLSAGVFEDTDDMLARNIEVIRELGLDEGEMVVITAGIPFAVSGRTNLIHVYQVPRAI